MLHIGQITYCWNDFACIISELLISMGPESIPRSGIVEGCCCRVGCLDNPHELEHTAEILGHIISKSFPALRYWSGNTISVQGKSDGG